MNIRKNHYVIIFVDKLRGNFPLSNITKNTILHIITSILSRQLFPASSTSWVPSLDFSASHSKAFSLKHARTMKHQGQFFSTSHTIMLNPHLFSLVNHHSLVPVEP